jgi:myosin heavy subunit
MEPMDKTRKSGDNRKTIYGILIAALVLTWGYMVYDKNKSSTAVQQLQTQVATVDNKRDAIQKEFNIASAKMDSLTGSNIKLSGSLNERNTEIQKLRTNIASILKNKNATAAELTTAKSMIDELNGKVSDLVAQVEKLQGENKQLTANNEQLNVDKTQLTTEKAAVMDTLQQVQTAKANVENVASTLHASNINIAAIDVKGNGKEKATTVAKRVDLMRVSFSLDENRIAPSGQKEIYVCVLDPNGNPITNGDMLNTKEDGEKKYTSKVNVDYEQGKTASVSFDWKPDGGVKYQPGDYKIQIYQNGYKIGEGTKSLKKGGLFS